MKKEVNIMDYAGDIIKALPQGILLTAKADGKVNPMTIGWGTIGIEWGTPIFTVFVRESRFTKGLLDKNPEFTVNIPLGEFDKKILGVCGKESGRDIDKVEKLGLTLEEPSCISVPGIKELPLTIECKVIYSQKQDENSITEENKQKYYPQNVDSSAPGANKDYHTAYYGEIVAAYIIE